MPSFDDMPVEYRREHWGWFGEPWPSGICYVDDSDTVVDWEMQKPTPVGELCLWCAEPFAADAQGSAIPSMTGDGGYEINHQHRECALRQVMGSYKHLTGGCPGDGSCHDEDTMTAREDALAVWKYFQEQKRAQHE